MSTEALHDRTADTMVTRAPTHPRRVVVIGGYGSVGRAVVRALSATTDLIVVIGGRDGDRAAALADSYGPGVIGTSVDVAQPQEVDRVLLDADVVVMCIERHNRRVAAQCLERGIDVVDVSATPQTVVALEGLQALAHESRARVLLSVGLAPGVTNLLARSCHTALPTADRVDITLSLGLGGDHGSDSTRWILDALVSGEVDGAASTVTSLPLEGRRRVHPLPFSDQFTMTTTLGIQVTTRVCFDSRLVTATTFGLRSVGGRRLLRHRAARRIVDAVSRVGVGGDRFVAHAAATDRRGRRVETAVSGRGECEFTGLVAAQATALLLDRSTPPGVHHLHELTDANTFLAGLAPGRSSHSHHGSSAGGTGTRARRS